MRQIFNHCASSLGLWSYNLLRKRKAFFIVSLALFNDFQMMLRKYCGMHLASSSSSLKKSQFALPPSPSILVPFFFQGTSLVVPPKKLAATNCHLLTLLCMHPLKIFQLFETEKKVPSLFKWRKKFRISFFSSLIWVFLASSIYSNLLFFTTSQYHKLPV